MIIWDVAKKEIVLKYQFDVNIRRLDLIDDETLLVLSTAGSLYLFSTSEAKII